MAGPKITEATKNKIVFAYAVFTVLGGYLAATQPAGAGWRFFSWHPFLMIVGFIGMMGSSAVIKKLGGYSNTKMHGILSSSGLLLAFVGLYVIYMNKEKMGKDHITTAHALAGIVTLAGAVLPAVAGGVFLHPDFGMDKTNPMYR
jgi:protein-S-isoprenylcysteine O-methyltransferase Ste14